MQALIVGAAALYDHIFPVRQLPSKGRVAEILATRPFETHAFFGGTAFNIAMALTKLEIASGVMHAVGGDFRGSEYEAWLAQHRVSMEWIQVHPEAQSGYAYLFFALDGRTLCFSYPGASAEPLALEGFEDSLGQFDILVVAPVFNASMSEILKMARKAGILTAACGTASDEFVPDLDLIDVLITNQYEMQRLCRRRSVQDPAALGIRMIFETYGRKGSCLYIGGEDQWIESVTPERAVDPTGAGDSYAGGVLAGLMQGLEPLQSGRLGSVVASYVLEKMGCQTNLPNWKRALERYKGVFPQDCLAL